MATARPKIPPKRVDPLKAAREQQAADEAIGRQRAFERFGDLPAAGQVPSLLPRTSPPEKGLEVPRRRRQRRISSQGIATSTGKPNVTI